jgi:hypothetical protein
MQIVIDIPEDIQKMIFDNEVFDIAHSYRLAMCVKNGKVLPAGHGRLIEDTPELERELWTYTRYTGIDEAPYESAVNVIDEAPTIIAACTLADADGGDAE